MGQMLYYFTRLGAISRGGRGQVPLLRYDQQSGDLHYSLFGKGSSTYYYDTQVIIDDMKAVWRRFSPWQERSVQPHGDVSLPIRARSVVYGIASFVCESRTQLACSDRSITYL